MTPAEPNPLVQAEELLRALWSVLGDEQTAVAMLDAAALQRTRDHKEQLTAALVALEPRALAGHHDQRRVDELRTLATRVVQQARANAVLLFDASDLLAERLGVRPEPGTYDARAQLRSTRRALVGKAA